MSEGVFAREYRLRKWPPPNRFLIVPFLVLIAIQHATSPMPLTVADVAVSVILPVCVVYLVLREVRGRTLLGPDGITVKGALRVRRIAWADIHDIRPEPVKKGPPWVVRVYDRAGRRFVLPHVNDEQVDDPAEVEAIIDAWKARRGPDWAPLPGTEAAIRLEAARRKAWMWAGIVGIVVMVCTFVVSIGLVFKDVDVPSYMMFVLPAAVFGVTGAALSLRVGRRA
ncbi:PH domain-containing protein [Streptomyces sp. NBC_01262]|uniref:PH domain-containing protein n=1 Tax=Streptomyces sp. NBC_01262 TaxID=2903803 RepID=UPI002E32CDB7|nr:PH domain-containing protein [Streptomyces sp. NBC_01262]